MKILKDREMVKERIKSKPIHIIHMMDTFLTMVMDRSTLIPVMTQTTGEDQILVTRVLKNPTMDLIQLVQKSQMLLFCTRIHNLPFITGYKLI